MVPVAKDVVEKDFISLQPDTSALEAARQMKAKRHGFAIIASPTGPVGIVTEWDYLSKIVAERKDASQVKLGEIMTRDLVGVDANDGLDQVAQLMAQRGIRRVLVLRNHQVIGLITASIMLSRLKEYIDRISTQIARLQGPMF